MTMIAMDSAISKLDFLKKNIDESQDAIQSLSKFIKFCWHIVEPGTPYVHGWHIDAICDHLEAVTHGEIRNLLINIPPRHAKSLLTSVFWPMWEWLRWPNRKFLCASYAMNLSIRDSLKCRRLITSPFFKAYYGHLFTLTKDQHAKTRFDNNHYGYRLATSVDGMGTGEGGDRILCLDYNIKINLKMGSLPIGYIVDNRISAECYSYNQTKNIGEYRQIINWYESETNTIIELVIDEKRKKSIILTPDHPVYIIGSGYVKAENIQANQLLRSSDNKQITIEKVIIKNEKRKMYNIEVEHNHNYFANDILVHNCDDPHSTSQAESELKRENCLTWWSETMSTRLNNPATGAKVIVMQRQHHKDLSGYVLARGGYEHLCLPAEYEGNKKTTVIGFSDPRTEDNELLWPERIPRKELEEIKRDLGSYAIAGQLQQRPSPREGGIIKRHWFQFFKLLKNPNGSISLSEFDYIIQSLDTAFKDGQENDFSVNTTWGVKRNGYYLISRWKGKVEFPELERVTISQASQFNPSQILIEDKASGQSLIQSIRKKYPKLPIKAVKVDRDKIARLHSVSGFFESGLVFLPENEHWVEDYIETMINFPAADYDDDVDSTTQALTEIALKMKNYGTISQIGSIMGR